MTNLGKTIFSAVLVSLLASCSLIGVSKWTAYKIVVEVHDQAGSPAVNVNVASSENQQNMTNEKGQTELFYTQIGLHVITLSAENKQTKQIKISLPQDNNKVITVVLKDK